MGDSESGIGERPGTAPGIGATPIPAKPGFNLKLGFPDAGSQTQAGPGPGLAGSRRSGAWAHFSESRAAATQDLIAQSKYAGLPVARPGVVQAQVSLSDAGRSGPKKWH